MPSLSDLRFAIRALRKSPGFTLVAVLTLGLCVGANTAVFTLVNAVLLRPLAYEQPERLVLVWESAPFFGLQDSPVAPANYADWRSRSRSFEEMGALEDRGYRLTSGGPPELVEGGLVTASLWRALRTRPAMGRLFSEAEDKPGAAKVAVISDGFWRRRFGADPSVLGRSVRLNDEPHTIVGVLAPGSEPPSEYRSSLGEIWTPLGSAYEPAELANRGRHNWMVIARLKPGMTMAQADAEMKAIGANLAREYPGTNERVGAFVAPLREHFVREEREVLFLLMGTVTLLLLIGCSNLAGLFVSRAAIRAKEIALRAALGAATWQLLRRFLWESLLICLLGAGAGLLLATFTFDFLARLAPGEIAAFQSLHVDWRVACFTLAIAAGTAFVFSVLPVFQLRRLDVGDSLKQSARTVAASAGSARTRRLLVGFEVSLAFVMLIGAGLLLRAFLNVRSVDPGFRTANVLALQMNLPRATDGTAAIAARQREMRRRILAIPGVEAAGVINHIPLLEKGDVSGFGAEGHPAAERFQANSRAVGPGYFATLGIPILSGRDIGETDADGAPLVVLINETLARRLWPGEDAVGRKLFMGQRFQVVVVGVVKDVRQSGLEVASKPEFYISSLQAGFPIGSMVIRTKGDPSRIASAVRAAVWSLDPEQPISNLTPMREVLDREVQHRREQTALLGAFAALALLLASIGLYGLLASIVSQQTAEIGLRMALGASPGEMMRRVMGHSFRLTIAGLAAGAAGAWALSRAMASLLFGVQPTDALTYGVVAAVLLLTALAASYLPARRAMRVEPMEALRQE